MSTNKKYGHITKTERLEIAILLEKNYSYRDMAKALGRHHTNISREIKKNSTSGIYDPRKANHKAYVKRKYSKYEGMRIVCKPRLQDYVEAKLKEGWSPELIAGRIKEVDTSLPAISHRVIYKFIKSVYGRLLEKYLPYKGRKKKKSKAIKSGLTDRVFIEQRPEIIENRGRFGDWEGDFIVSGKSGHGVLLVLYERKSRYTIIQKVLSTRPDIVNYYFKQITGGILCMNSLTLDNDIAFKKHRELSESLGVPIYFCRPYHSWEKGGVESVNGLIRRDIPKGSDISQFANKFIQMVQDKLNNRPRKCLNYQTPQEVMEENQQFKYVKMSLNFLQTKMHQVVHLGV